MPTLRSDSTEDAREELSGIVETITFRAEDTGYTVCSVRVPGQRDTVTVVGACPAIWVGEHLRAEGEWVQHRRHGRQFKADKLACIPPTSAKGIERYLASGMIRGISKVMAKRLVDKFGDDTLHVIEKESERLREVEGIGPKRRRWIKESWKEQRAVRDIMIFLQGHGIGTAHAARIYREYGADTVALITENPYRLCPDVWGIGFKTADEVARSVGVPSDSPVRARAGLIHVLQTMTDEGHCFCPEPELLLQAEALLGTPVEILADALRSQIEAALLVKEEGRIYLASIHRAECRVAEKLRALHDAPAPFRPILAEKAVAWAQARMKLDFDPEQAEALRTTLSEKVTIMTGGPGVGKTTIIRALVDVFGARRLQVVLAAPTGRAAKRMAEATGHDASTIHRLLKYLPQKNRFEHGADNPLGGDVFILDEVSMIDIRLMADFLAAVPDRGCLVLVGDTDQLPSVGPGNVLRDIIQSGLVPCRELRQVFRQEKGGWIVRNAHRVNRGDRLELPARGDDSADFYFIEAQDSDHAVDLMLGLVADRIPRRFGLDPLRDVQVLTPMRRNQLGADNLNLVLQKALNASGHAVERFGRSYREGDRVMQIRNNYDKEIFNGDIGRIVRVDTPNQSLHVDFDGRRVPYEFSEVDELVHAYACSIHKSQGSEYPAVVILMTTQHFKLLQRNLLYTAITRGRKLACLVGSSKAVNIAIRNNEIRMRRTSLRERLRVEG